MRRACSVRTEYWQRRLVREMQRLASSSHRADRARAVELSKQSSTHPVVSAFWGLGAVDVHRKFTHEVLHNHSLGVSPLIVDLIHQWARSTLREGELNELANTLKKALEELPP